MTKLRINMFAKGEDVPGQGVGSAYKEQVKLLREHATQELEITENAKPDGDVNHFNTVHPGSYFRLLRSKAPTVMHVHFLPTTLDGSIKLPRPAFAIFKRYVMSFYRRADHLVTVNPTFIHQISDLGIASDKISYIPNYVSRADFRTLDSSERVKFRKLMDIDPQDFVVLGVGQVQTRKGVLDFVECAKRLPQYQFVWCGGISFRKITDGYDDLKKIVENPPENVRFVGIIPREQMNQFYNVANCLFLPSYNELFPMSILEASNLHVPIVVRDLELYEDILSGKYLSAHDVEGFVRALESLAEDEATRQKWTDASRAIEEYYSPERVSKLWIDYYRDIAENG